MIVNESSDRKRQLVFITWAEDCARSDSIAKRLGGRPYLVYSPFWGSRYATALFKYFSQSIKTLRILFREQPQIVLIMTPPVIACIPVWIYAKLTGAQYAIDAHTSAFVDKPWKWALFIHRFFSRSAIFTIVTGEFLAGIVRQWGAKEKIVRDVPLYFAEPGKMQLAGEINMVFVSTFTRDEPLEAFLDAAAQVPDVHFYVTGRLKDAKVSLVRKASRNVTFTDFLSRSDYVGLLLASDAVICLTIADHTMQRGAYEAIYLSKPVITSDFKLLREAFPKGTVHVTSAPDDIARGIREMKMNLAKCRREAEELRLEKLNSWREVAADFNRSFGEKSIVRSVLEMNEDTTRMS